QHYLIYHSRIPKQKVNNIYWIRDAQLKPGEIEPHKGHFNNLKSRMSTELIGPIAPSSSLSKYCTSFDERYGVEAGTGLRVARMLMQERALKVDLGSPSLVDEPLDAFLMTSRPGRLRAVGGA